MRFDKIKKSIIILPDYFGTLQLQLPFSGIKTFTKGNPPHYYKLASHY